jgi:O-6-methylguanine DNA methyltransferase
MYVQTFPPSSNDVQNYIGKTDNKHFFTVAKMRHRFAQVCHRRIKNETAFPARMLAVVSCIFPEVDMETLYYSRLQSLAGPLIIGVSQRGLVLLEFDRGNFPRQAGKAELTWQESSEATREYVRELEEYFAGRRRDFSFGLDLRGTPFQVKCWRALLEIPYGETRTYADIARAVGQPKGFRAVGLANNRNPIAIVVPCHRVIASDGTLCGYGGGLDIKRKLLELEGVHVGEEQHLFAAS